MDLTGRIPSHALVSVESERRHLFGTKGRSGSSAAERCDALTDCVAASKTSLGQFGRILYCSCSKNERGRRDIGRGGHVALRVSDVYYGSLTVALHDAPHVAASLRIGAFGSVQFVSVLP